MVRSFGTTARLQTVDLPTTVQRSQPLFCSVFSVVFRGQLILSIELAAGSHAALSLQRPDLS